ncbi:MAG TPA: alpha/beta hydrolase family protein, partial [Chryseolinea sp.]
MKTILFLLIFLVPLKNIAQTVNLNVPELAVPATLDQWKKQRKDIRQTLVRVMGDLPARPKVTPVKTLSREDKGAYTLEKFEFDNGAGAIVPGYLLIPNNGKPKH